MVDQSDLQYKQEVINTLSRLEGLTVGDFISVGFSNSNALLRLKQVLYEVATDYKNGTIKEVKKVVDEENNRQDKKDKDKAKDANKKIEDQTKQIKETNKSLKEQLEDLKKEFISTGKISFSGLRWAQIIAETSKSILGKITSNTLSFQKMSLSLQESGIMIGRSAGQLQKSLLGGYTTISNAAVDFNTIMTYAANKSGKSIEDFSKSLMDNSQLYTRLNSMGIEGATEIGELYSRMVLKNGDLSMKATDAIIKHWGENITTYYTREEYLRNQFNVTLDNLTTSMSQLSQATGKSVENILKEQALKSNNFAIRKLENEYGTVVKGLKQFGFSEEMIVGMFTGRITKELNQQLLNNPNLQNLYNNIRQRISYDRNTGRLGNSANDMNLLRMTQRGLLSIERERKAAIARNDYLLYNTNLPLNNNLWEQQGVFAGFNPYALDFTAIQRGINSNQSTANKAYQDMVREKNRVFNELVDMASVSLGGFKSAVDLATGSLKGLGAIIPSSMNSPILSGITSALTAGIGVIGTVGGTVASIMLSRKILESTGITGGATNPANEPFLPGLGPTSSGSGILSKYPKLARYGRFGGYGLTAIFGALAGAQGARTTEGTIGGAIGGGIGGLGGALLGAKIGSHFGIIGAVVGSILGGGLGAMGGGFGGREIGDSLNPALNSRTGSMIEGSFSSNPSNANAVFVSDPTVANLLQQLVNQGTSQLRLLNTEATNNNFRRIGNSTLA